MLIKPNWPLPKNIHAYSTTRLGGVSQKPYDSFNLGTHVNDNIENVLKNRQILIDTLKLPNTPIWIKQIHGKTVLTAFDDHREKEADATISDQPNQVCVILTADCLPILIADKKGKKVAAVHAGWRGLAKKVITETLHKLALSAADTFIWLGPAISQKFYQVGEEVRESFINDHDAFIETGPKQWLCDLYQLARNELHSNGIDNIYGGEYCTYTQSDQFFSYRRDGLATGRMATLIWYS
jgi:YfiH family protein